MKINLKYHFKLHSAEKGFWAECIELEGCVTQADNKNKLFVNMQEALNTYLEEPDDSEFLALLPSASIRKAKNIVEVSVNQKIAFGFMQRYHRLLI